MCVELSYMLVNIFDTGQTKVFEIKNIWTWFFFLIMIIISPDV